MGARVFFPNCYVRSMTTTTRPSQLPVEPRSAKRHDNVEEFTAWLEHACNCVFTFAFIWARLYLFAQHMEESSQCEIEFVGGPESRTAGPCLQQ